MSRNNKPSATLILLGSLVCLVCLAGCMGRPYIAGVPAASPELTVRRADQLKPQLEARLKTMLPDEAKVVQRLSLMIGHKQYDLIGYLLYRQPADFRAVAMGEMGGRVFDFLMLGDACKIVDKPAGMPPRPLTDGVMKDIRHLFGRPSFEGGRIVKRPGHEVGLVIPAGEDGLAEYVFRLPGLELTRSLESRRGRIVREAVYSAPRPQKNWPQPFPAHIRIDNLRWHYTLEIEVLEIGPCAIGAAMLKAQ